MGNVLDESWKFPEIKKPVKPLKVDRPRRGLSSALSSESKAWADQQYNFLTEMFKVMPGYEQSEYLNDHENSAAEINQYGSDFGRVADAKTAQGFGVGMGAIADYAEDIDFRPAATQFDHNLNSEFADLNLEMLSFSGMSPTLYQRINAKYDADSRSFYEMIMEHNAQSLSAMSSEDAFLMMGALFESRSRVYTAMTTLFGDPNVDDDAARIEHINQWLQGEDEGQGLSDDNKRIFLTFLGAFRAYFSRIKALMGLGNDDILSTADRGKFQDFGNVLQTKAQEYVESLGISDPGKEEAMALYDAWYEPDEDATGWFQSKGKRIQKTGDVPGQLDEIFDNVNVLNNGQLTGRSKEKILISDAEDGQNLHLGKAYDEIWGVHAYGVLKYFEDHLVDQSVIAGARNRSDFHKYMEEMKAYDIKIEEAKEQETDQKKSEEKRRAEQEQERRKLEQKSLNQARQFRAELQKALQKQIQRTQKSQKQNVQQVQKTGQEFKARMKKAAVVAQNKTKQKTKALMTAEQKKAQMRASEKRKTVRKSSGASMSEQLHKLMMKKNKENSQKQKQKNSV